MLHNNRPGTAAYGEKRNQTVGKNNSQLAAKEPYAPASHRNQSMQGLPQAESDIRSPPPMSTPPYERKMAANYQTNMGKGLNKQIFPQYALV